MRQADSGQQQHPPQAPQQQQELLASSLVLAPDFMDIEVDEPIECKCRQCDSMI
jgi:hypothetical protein